jgi:hypothetical protein
LCSARSFGAHLGQPENRQFPLLKCLPASGICGAGKGRTTGANQGCGKEKGQETTASVGIPQKRKLDGGDGSKQGARQKKTKHDLKISQVIEDQGDNQKVIRRQVMTPHPSGAQADEISKCATYLQEPKEGGLKALTFVSKGKWRARWTGASEPIESKEVKSRKNN